ncbi:hypothetical protein [Paenibacillus cymbidii]|uniref:hypothetical protein n=1 Tax=Paenibacillus cymbidii TaxID=1639034 RepID=UPI0010819A8B|nr:hypothetical protein [Paenibacillus cymbidii]
MTKWQMPTVWQKVRHQYGREREATQLMASREKSVIELGHVAHAKIAAGHISDPELTAISHTIDGWDRMLHELQERRGQDGANALSGYNFPDSVGGEPAKGDSAHGVARTGVHPVWRFGGFGAFLSVILLLAFCLAISTVANRLLDQAVASGKSAVAERVQGAADQVKEKLDEVKPGLLGGPLSERAAGKVRDALQSKWSALTDFQHATDFDLLDVPLTYLLVHNVASKATLHIGGNVVASELNVHAGIYAFLLVPLLAFAIGGYVAAWRMRVKSAKQALWLSLVMGAANALFLMLLASLAGFSTAVDLPGKIGSIDVAYRFSLASALWNGLVLGAAFSLFGAMLRLTGFRWGKHWRSGVIPYGEAVHQAMLTLLYGVGASLLYALVLLWIKGSLSTVLVLLLPQLAVYVWGIANGSVFHMTNIFAGQGKQLEVSVFTGIQGAGMNEYAAEWYGFLIAAALLPIVLFLLAGKRMKQDLGHSSKVAMVFSVAYAGLLSILTMLMQIGISVRGSSAVVDTKSVTLEAGFSGLATFVTSFIVAYACVSLGLKWNRRKLSA